MSLSDGLRGAGLQAGLRKTLRDDRLIAFAAGLASATGFAPLDWWPVTLLCFALLIALLERVSNSRAAFQRGWLFGLGHFAVSLNWIAHAFTFQDAMPHWFGYGAVVLLSLYLALFPGLAAFLAWRLHHHFRTFLPLLFAAVWVISEWLRATLFTGFAWNPLGAAWLPTWTAQGAEWIGAYGLSGLFILAAAGLLLALRRRFAPALAFAAPALAFALYGAIVQFAAVRSPGEVPSGPAIRIVQPNIGQQDKHVEAFEEQNFRKLAQLSGVPSDRPRLLFWPEAAIPAYLDMEPEWRYRLAALLGPNDLLLTGGTKVYFKEIQQKSYTGRTLSGANNSLFVVTPQGTLAGRYDKAHLVPYGEYLPLRALLEPIGLSRLVPGDVDFWPGPGPRSLVLPAAPGRPALKMPTLKMPTLKMGVQICYEIIFSGHVVDRANRPDFLFNPSNDAWFGAWGPPQHLAQARLRAIEEGLPIIRSTPTGISAVIDSAGTVLHSIPHRRAGFIDATLPRPAAATLFSRTGNLAPLLLALFLAALAIGGRKRSS